MIHYRKILELHDEGISLRGIAASTSNSRQKVTVNDKLESTVFNK